MEDLNYIPITDKTKSIEEVKQEIDPEIRKHIDLVESVFEINSDNFSRILKLIEETEQYPEYFANLLFNAVFLRPKNAIIFVDLLYRYFKDGKIDPAIIYSGFNTFLLINKVIKKYYEIDFLKSTEKSINDLPEGSLERKISELLTFVPNEITQKEINKDLGIYPKGSIERAIIEDDINLFINLTSYVAFDPSDTIEIGKGIIISDKRITKVSYIQFMELYGSIKCFKHAYLNEEFPKDNLQVFAIAGGNKEIIRLLEIDGYSFDNCFKVAVYYHQCELYQWLLNNYKCEICDYGFIKNSFNEFIMEYMIKNNINLTQENLENAFIVAADEGDVITVKYLLDKCKVNVNCCNDGRSALNRSANNLKMVKLLIEKYGANYTIKNKLGFNLLFSAIFMNSLDVVKYAINELKMEGNNYNSYMFPPLYIAIKMGCLDISDYLIKLYPSLLNKQDKNTTIFEWLIDKGDIESLKLVKKRYNIDFETYDEDNELLFKEAVYMNKINVIKYFIEDCHMKIDKKVIKKAIRESLIHHNLEVNKYLTEKYYKKPGYYPEFTKEKKKISRSISFD